MSLTYNGGRMRGGLTLQRPSGSWTHEFSYDGRRVIQERNESNTPQVSYTRGRELSGTLEGAGGIGGLLARTESGSHAYYHADGNGNVTFLLAANQTLAARYVYNPYGNTVSQTGSLADANVYRFSSKEHHARSGLYYYLYRWYEPRTQRWMNRDPIHEQGGLNLFQYCSNDGLRLFDPYGLAEFVGGFVVCGQNGTFEAKTTGLTTGKNRECSKAHEQQHIEDLKALFPDACKGVKPGQRPIIPPDKSDAFERLTECRAYKAGKECRDKMLCNTSQLTEIDIIDLTGQIKSDEEGIKKNCSNGWGLRLYPSPSFPSVPLPAPWPYGGMLQ